MARLHRDGNREQVWRRHLELQRFSGLTVRAYCRANALQESAFFFWKKEIAKRDRESTAPPNAAPAFVPVTVIDPPAKAHTDAPIDIRLAEGHRVRVRSGCDRNLLAEVLTLLRGSRAEGRPC